METQVTGSILIEPEQAIIVEDGIIKIDDSFKSED